MAVRAECGAEWEAAAMVTATVRVVGARVGAAVEAMAVERLVQSPRSPAGGASRTARDEEVASRVLASELEGRGPRERERRAS